MRYELKIDGDGEMDTVRLVLTDEAGNLVAKRTFRLSDHNETLLTGLFEPGCFAERSRVSGLHDMDGPDSETSSTMRLGLFLGRDLLGEEIAGELGRSFEDYGFAVVCDHGIDRGLIETCP